MKKLATLAAAGALALSLAVVGCGQATDDQGTKAPAEDVIEDDDDLDDDDDADELDDDDDDVPVTGGWSANTQVGDLLTDDERALFEAATEGLVGVAYQPVAVLGTQVVAGTNYAFLCTGTTSDAAATEGWYVLVVYEDLEGKAQLTSAEDVELDDVELADEDDETEVLMGGWEIREAAASELLPAEAQQAFEAAIEAYDGMSLSPIACLGTQVVSGTNYLLLCSGEMVVPDARPGLYVVEVYADLDGNATITNVGAFDLLSYLDD